MSKSVYEELVDTLKVSQKKGEDDQDHLTKLVSKANDITDASWNKLGKKAQTWINKGIEAVDSREEIPAPDGFGGDDVDEDEEVEEEAEAEEVEAEEDEDETPRRKAKSAKPEKKALKGKEKEKPAKVAKGKPEKKAIKGEKKAKSKKGNGIAGRRPRLFTDDQRIIVLTKDNPKREGSESFERFENYVKGKKGMTVRQALDAGVTSGDLKWDNDHEFIEIK